MKEQRPKVMDAICHMGKNNNTKNSKEPQTNKQKQCSLFSFSVFEATEKNITNRLIMSRGMTFHANPQRTSNKKRLPTHRENGEENVIGWIGRSLISQRNAMWIVGEWMIPKSLLQLTMRKAENHELGLGYEGQNSVPISVLYFAWVTSSCPHWPREEGESTLSLGRG